jgi:hypothetical protein
MKNDRGTSKTMITVRDMIEALSIFPPDALCYAYEGEVTGVVIVDNNGPESIELGVIEAYEEWDE